MQNHGKVIEKKSKSHEIFAHYFRVLQKHTHAYKNSHANQKILQKPVILLLL